MDRSHICDRCNSDHAGCKNRLGMGSTHKSTWHIRAPADMTPACGVDSHLSTSVGDSRLLWSRIRLFCTLQAVAIFEYPLFVSLSLFNSSHSFHVLPQVSKPMAFFPEHSAWWWPLLFACIAFIGDGKHGAPSPTCSPVLPLWSLQPHALPGQWTCLFYFFPLFRL